MGKDLNLYRKVYSEWYCVSCDKSNEEPVSFSTYVRLVPQKEAEEMNNFLLEGRTP